jgi:transcriptional regulator with XRE-family HTH domain
MQTRAEFPGNLRSARHKKGYTQEKLAELAGTSRRHVIRWEQGENLPSSRYRRILTDLLDEDFTDIEGEGENKEDTEMAMAIVEALKTFVDRKFQERTA